MIEITYSYFIKILLEIIQELNLDTTKSVFLLYIYTLIVYNVFSTYYLKFNTSINNPINYRHYWFKTILHNEKFYNDFMIQINLNLLFMLNEYLDSEIVKKYFKQDFKFIYNDSDYINFLKYSHTIIEEIRHNIQIHLNLIFSSDDKKNFLNKEIITDNSTNKLV